MLRVVRQSVSKTAVLQRGFGAAAAVDSSSGGVPGYATNAAPVEVSTAGNGVKVVTEATFAGEGVVSMSVKVNAGSRYETANVNGIAAFAAAASMESIAGDAAKLGGHFSVCTDRETSTFTANVMRKDVPKAMELLGKAVTGDVSTCNRDARAGYVECTTSDYRTGIMDQLHEAAFLSTPLAMSPLGSGTSVAGLSAPDLTTFKKNFYSSDAIHVSVAGAGVDHAGVKGLVEKSMTAGAPSSSLAKVAAPAMFTGSDKRIRFDSHPDALVAVAFEAASATSADVMPMHIMKEVLGSWQATGPIGANSSNK
jgi:processing peptidase subunit beta